MKCKWIAVLTCLCLCLLAQTGCAYHAEGGSSGHIGLTDFEVMKWEETHNIDVGVDVEIPILTNWLKDDEETD